MLPPVPPFVIVIHAFVFATFQLHAASVRTFTLPDSASPPWVALPAESENAHGTPACTMFNDWPAITTVPVRLNTFGFAVTA